ncbi:MAG: zf-HC2 domain-containing protein [Gammaproteobacteria bacterium]|nr:zf-HC2 domain-containing protein [Gammaproteobacteria bacterium]
MLNCAEASRLASEKRDRALTRRERLGFRFHLLMCRNCRRYAAQLALLGRAARQLRRRNPPVEADSRTLPEARQRIAERLREADPGGKSAGARRS